MITTETQTREQSIAELQQEFTDAWNRGDVEALCALFTEDAVRVGGWGDVQRGRAELRAAYSRLFNGPLAGATVEFDWTMLRHLGPDLALSQGTLEVRRRDGGEPLIGYALELLRREGGRWRIVEAHPKFFPPRLES